MARNQSEFMGLTSFVWWYGVVEDRFDPLKAGRVRVRVFGWHPDDADVLPTERLPWAVVLQPVTSAATEGVGQTPMGPIEGTWVMGHFMDGEQAQYPVVLGCIAGIQPDVGEPDVNRLARPESRYPHRFVDDRASVSEPTYPSVKNDEWGVPARGFHGAYPYVHVSESEAGHLTETNDTPGHERTWRRHASGTFEEVTPFGDRVVRIVGDGYEVVAGSNYVHVTGNASISVDGTLDILAGSINMAAETMTLDVGTLHERTQQRHVINDGDVHTFTGRDTYSRHAEGIDHSCPIDPSRTSKIDCSDVEEP